jgi:hypothetical protein
MTLPEAVAQGNEADLCYRAPDGVNEG